MDNIISLYLIWFLIGLPFFIAEMAIPGFILFFFGLGAWVVSIVTAIFPDISFNKQILLFSISSIGSLLILRNYLKSVFLGVQNEGNDSYGPMKEGDNLAVVTKDIKADGSYCEIKFQGTFYKAKSNEDIDINVGENVKVLDKGDQQGTYYIVEK